MGGPYKFLSELGLCVFGVEVLFLLRGIALSLFRRLPACPGLFSGVWAGGAARHFEHGEEVWIFFLTYEGRGLEYMCVLRVGFSGGVRLVFVAGY